LWYTFGHFPWKTLHNVLSIDVTKVQNLLGVIVTLVPEYVMITHFNIKDYFD